MSDLISRQDAIRAVMTDVRTERTDCLFHANMIADRINKLPSAQPRMKGKWIATKEWCGRNYFCSCCNFSFMVDTCMLEPMWNFCPNCGARMSEGEENEKA